MFRNFITTVGPFVQWLFRPLALASCTITVLSEEDFDGPLADVLDVVIVSYVAISVGNL